MPSDTSKRPLTILPTFSSSSRSPHIRTPSTTSKFTPSSSFPLKIPRSLLKVLLFLSFVVGLIFLSQVGKDGGIEEGLWDASSYSERRGTSPGVNIRKIQNKFGLIPPPKPKSPPNRSKTLLLDDDLYSDPEEDSLPRLTSEQDQREYIHNDEEHPQNYISKPRLPSTSRTNSNSTRVNHPGKSRRVISGSSPEKYTTGPLPTLEEAWQFLHPLLREVKEKYQVIPREHELTAPIFPPFLNDDLVSRFRHLREEWDEGSGEWRLVSDRRWFLVTVCRQVAGMLADWFATWTVLADFLGPESLVFSLIEGDSADGSGEIISHAMRAHLLNIGVPPENINIKTFAPKFDWEQIHRIEQLAKMRNEGMQPFYDTLPSGLSPDGHPWTGIVYYNDVYLSATHFLELMHQHFKQDADMTCGWDHAGKWFYDGWVGRDMSGDLYTPFPVKEEDKDLPQKLFPSSPQTLKRYERMLPFQVFAGWNGITVLNPQPFYPPYNVRFRRAKPRTEQFWECQASESSFISWDFWKYGFGRVQVIPGVHATYGKEDAMLRGWVEWPTPGPGNGAREEIDWIDE
nr:hypothetical protein I302_01335 [Kwoniella bestiolae CBS 10118]OCF29822.1 hypothetical protein I302_01335 [Kwoniella bestiolae CBS 10118]